MTALDWPVAHGAAAIVGPDGVERRRAGDTELGRDWEVASVTKLLTAMATLAAIESGHLELDQLVDSRGATVRHLLAHASGLPMSLAQSRRRPVGERRIYSNEGYRLLGEVVADAMGTSFSGWLASSVLEPLEMGGTRLNEGGGLEPDPAAGAVSTLADLTRFARCLLDRGDPVVGRELFDQATSVQFPGLPGLVPGVGRFDPCDWGLGFELRDAKRPHWMGERRSAASFGHFGASGCFLWVDPAVPLAVAGVSDRDFDDDRWAMTTWPAWSDALPAA